MCRLLAEDLALVSEHVAISHGKKECSLRPFHACYYRKWDYVFHALYLFRIPPQIANFFYGYS